MALFQSPLCSALCSTLLNLNALFPPNNPPSREEDPLGQLNREIMLQEMANRQQQQQQHLASVDSSLGRRSSTCTQVVWIFFWLLFLILIAYPIAFCAALLYALLNPLNLIQSLKPFMELLMKALNFPFICFQNMIEAKQLIVM